MRKSIFFIPVILNLILFSCTSDVSDGGLGDGSPLSTPRSASNPWRGIGTGFLPEGGNSDLVRVLQFRDGMVISYDGSNPSGGEEVCRSRREQDTWYEVCMSLEDDPYFTGVLRLLAFTRFVTELSCYSWDAVNETRTNRTEMDCETVVFPAMGGAAFDCEARLHNGDKSLSCTDDWGVVVNGFENQPKTLCRAHLPNGTGRCLGAPKEGMEDVELLLAMQQTSWEGYQSTQDNNKQFSVGEMARPLAPQNIPPGASLNYFSTDESVCTVDSDNSNGGVGSVRIDSGVMAPTECRIYLEIEVRRFADRVVFVDLPILKPNDAIWGDYQRQGNYFYPGESLSAQAVDSNEPASTSNQYQSLDDKICTVDSSGTILAVAPGSCKIRLTASAEDYLDRVIEKTIPVDTPKDVADIEWSSFPTSATVGVPTGDLRAATPVVKIDDENGVRGDLTDPNLVLDISYEKGGCNYDSSTGILSFEDTSECVLVVVSSGVRGYGGFIKEFKVTPAKGAFAVNWNGYMGSNIITYGGRAPNVEPPTTSPALSEVTYVYGAMGGGCEVDVATGALTIIGANRMADESNNIEGRSCEVTVTAFREFYEDATSTLSLVINKSDQTLTPPTQAYGSAASLNNGASLEVINPPTGGRGRFGLFHRQWYLHFEHYGTGNGDRWSHQWELCGGGPMDGE